MMPATDPSSVLDRDRLSLVLAARLRRLDEPRRRGMKWNWVIPNMTRMATSAPG